VRGSQRPARDGTTGTGRARRPGSLPATGLRPRDAPGRDSARAPRAVVRTWVRAALLLLLALLVRAVALDRDELWFDEAYAALVALQPPSGILSELKVDSSPPLYYLALHAWMTIAGQHPVALRTLSVAAAIPGVVLCGVLGARLGNTLVGWLAMLLLAVSPLHVYYSREVRPYSLLVTLALLAMLALERLVRRGRARDAAAAGLALLATAYTHNYGLLLAVPLAAAAAARLVAPGRALIALGILAAGYAPWLPVLVAQTVSGATSWIARWWQDTPPAAALLRSVAAFTFGGATPPYITLGQEPLPAIVSVAACLVFGAVVLCAFVPPSVAGVRRAAAAALLILGVPFAVSFVSPVYLVARHDVIVLPLFLVICAAGLARMRLPLRLAGVAVTTALAALALAAYYQRPPARTLSARAAVLARAADPGDAVVTTGFTRNTVEYYVRLAGGRQSFHSFPRSFDLHRGWLDERELADPVQLEAGARGLVAEVLSALDDGKRVWIVHSRELSDADAVLMAAFQQVLEQRPCPGGGEEAGFTCWQR
jgi:mannosyltransferase